jgi:hypothetical protein
MAAKIPEKELLFGGGECSVLLKKRECDVKYNVEEDGIEKE